MELFSMKDNLKKEYLKLSELQPMIGEIGTLADVWRIKNTSQTPTPLLIEKLRGLQCIGNNKVLIFAGK